MPYIVRCTIFKVRNIRREQDHKKHSTEIPFVHKITNVPVYCEIRLGTSGLFEQQNNQEPQTNFVWKKTEVFNEDDGEQGSALVGGVFDFEHYSDEVL